MTDETFEEPGGGWRAWVSLLIAGYFLVGMVFPREGSFDRLAYLAFGIAVLGMDRR